MHAKTPKNFSNRMIFLLGMPRSGTKLLVTVLGRHPEIARTILETDFLPCWIENWPHYGDLSDRKAFKRFYQKTLRLPYFLTMKARGKLIPEDAWYKRCREYSVSGVFEALLRHDTHADENGKHIIIDKSPSYTRHIRLLRQHFPKAQFIHIIRDVRDYCLSINRAWGKNMIRAAHRWTQDVQRARHEGRLLGEDYFELKYEELLADPRPVVENLCGFIGIEFDEAMLELSRPTEYVGDAKGIIGIKQDNVAKYIHSLNPRARRSIEGIAAPVLESLGYPVEYNGKPITISKLRLMFYQIMDALNLLRSSIKEKGITHALRFNLRALLSRR